MFSPTQKLLESPYSRIFIIRTLAHLPPSRGWCLGLKIPVLPSLAFPSHVDSCPQEFEQAPGDGEGQGSLACYSPWDCRLGHNLATEQQVLRQELVTKPNIFLLIPQISKDFLIIINHP